MRFRTRLLPLVVLVVLGVSALAVSSATGSSNPKWYIGGSELSGSETLGGLAEPSKLTVAGVSTECEHSYYYGQIFNSSGAGNGELTYLPLYGCSADAGCTLSSIEPKHLPWPMHTVFEESKPYLIIEDVSIETTYTGSSCAIKGTSEVTGSMGGAIENAEQKTVFDSASASATGTSLKVGSTAVAFEGSYTEEAAGPEHRGEPVEAK